MDKTTLSFRPQGVGKYKTARAYVRLDPGEGRFIINGEPAGAYFAENPRWQKALAPFKAAGLDAETFDIQARMVGRAKSWSKRQPRALAHAIAGALAALDPTWRDQLWQAGFRCKVLSGPDWILEFPEGAWLAPSIDPGVFWAKYHALFLRPLPKKWADNPHVLTFGGRWLLDVLLIPLQDDDLKRVRDYLDEQGQAVSDVDILSELFHITYRDDNFDRWRFTLNYQLSQKAEGLGVEFVGSGTAWAWALQTAPIEKPERHRRLPGTDGLPIKYIEVERVEAELTGDDELLDEPAEELTEEWKPTRPTWEYVLTYYDWYNGVLPYNRQVREMIPPLNEGQCRALLRFTAEQVADDPFEVGLYAHSRTSWLHGMGLQELFVGYLVPGARIWIDRTEEPGLYKIRYRRTEPQCRRLLFFKEEQIRPVIEDRKITCEVDETMLLAEGRYSNIEALDWLDLVDRRTAPKVLALVFELIGLKDESRDVYRAQFDDVFPLLCITKPYSKNYVKNILYSRKKYPWFYRDEERGAGWFVYDPEQDKVVAKPRRPRTPRPTEGVWGEVVKLKGHGLATLDQENPFRIVEVADTSLQILVERTGQRRTIRREEIENAWQYLVSQGELSRSEIRAHCSEFNPAYVSAILAALPGVTHKTQPIRLYYGVVPTPVEVPDIGIRHIIYPISFVAGELPEQLRNDRAWDKRFGEEQLRLWKQTWTPKDLDEALIQIIADKDSNRFVTPREVVDFMINLAQPEPGERVADICCGTGIFLVKAQRFVKEVYGEGADLELYGADIYGVEAAYLNLRANGAYKFKVIKADSLQAQEDIFDAKYDLILGNPPFGGGQCQRFIQRWAGLLKDDGRMVVNVSEGVLANTGQADQELRRWLVENFEIEAVINLPWPHDSQRYGAKSNVLYLRKIKPKQGHRSLLIQIQDYAQIPSLFNLSRQLQEG